MKKLIVSGCIILVSALIFAAFAFITSLNTLFIILFAGIVALAIINCIVTGKYANLKFFPISYIVPFVAYLQGWIDGPTQLILMPFLWLPILINYKLVRKIEPLMFLDLNTILVDAALLRSSTIRYGLDIVETEEVGKTLLMVLVGFACMMSLISVLFKKVSKHQHHKHHHHHEHHSEHHSK